MSIVGCAERVRAPFCCSTLGFRQLSSSFVFAVMVVICESVSSCSSAS